MNTNDEDFYHFIRTQYERLLIQSGPPRFDVFKYIIEEKISQKTYPYDVLKKFEIWWEDFHTFSFLKEFFQDPTVTEILLHSFEFIQIERNGELKALPFSFLKISKEDWQLCLEVFSLTHQINWNYSHPFVSFQSTLKKTSFRATLLHFSLTPQKKDSKLFLRKQAPASLNLSHFHLTKQEEIFLKKVMKEKRNLLIAGSTSSGKTSLLRTLLGEVSWQEHVVILEDTYELNLLSPSCTQLLSNSKEKLIDLCSYSLRLRPDRIILGEIRSEEIVPFFLNMNTGHKGLLSTIHSNSALDALSRSALLMSLFSPNKEVSYDLCMRLICHNLDYVIFMENRKVSQMIKILGSDQGRALVDHALVL